MRLLPCIHSQHRILRPDITRRLRSGLLLGPNYSPRVGKGGAESPPFPTKRAGAWGTPKVQDFLLL